MEELFKNYYFGMITCSLKYYREITAKNNQIQEPHKRQRWIGNRCYDPFYNCIEENATRIGEPTLLYRDGEKYYDLRFSLYDDELCYEMEKENSIGITLNYIESFLDWNSTFCADFILQAIAQQQKDIYFLNNLSYFVYWNLEKQRYDIIIQNPETLSDFYYEYLEKQSIKGEDNFSYLKDYYLGIISIDPKQTYSFLSKREKVLDYFLWNDLSAQELLEKGIPTVLYKKEERYYDIYYNRYPNDLIYTLGTPKQGITLEMVEPFIQRFPILPRSISSLPSFEDIILYLRKTTIPYLSYEEEGYDYPLLEIIDMEPLYTLQEEWLEEQKVYKKDKP